MKAFKTVVDKKMNYDGFTITFTNKNTISVMFGSYTYSDNGETTAEVAAWDKDGLWMVFQNKKWITLESGTEVMPRQTPEQVIEMMSELSKL